jgi:hypothetical protein
MGIFDTIKNAIFGHHAAAPAGAAPAPGGPAPSAPAAGATQRAAQAVPASQASTPAPAATASTQRTLSEPALEAHLAQLSAQKQQKLNWQSSIVDLMKLVGLDPSLANRQQLARELGYQGDMQNSAEMNVWLHKAVMEKLAQEGGTAGAGLH